MDVLHSSVSLSSNICAETTKMRDPTHLSIGSMDVISISKELSVTLSGCKGVRQLLYGIASVHNMPPPLQKDQRRN